MPNAITPSGLQIKTRDEIIAELTNGTTGFPGYRTIYGANINLDPNSPDGQFLNLMAQIAIDVEEFLQQIYNAFDPDTAIGVNLDRACAYNGVARLVGTPSTQLVTVTVTQALTLPGLDTFPTAPFVISDNAGNQFALMATHTFGAAGSANLNFQAVNIGPTVVAANSLTTIVTILLGVASVTNGSLAGTVGTAAESNASLRLRRQQSVSLPSKGFADGLRGALLAISGVTAELVLENDTDTTDANGIPSHSIWVIVNGGTDAAIAAAIYVKRNAGCGMKGATTVNVPQADGTTFPIKFSRPTAENLWISIDAAALTGPAVDATYLRAQLLAGLKYGINQTADASDVVALAKTIYPGAAISAEGVSPDDTTYSDTLVPTAVNYQFVLAAARIYINGAHG